MALSGSTFRKLRNSLVNKIKKKKMASENRRKLNVFSVFLQILTISNAFQITSLWRRNQHKAKGSIVAKCETHECKFKQMACLKDCQRGLARGLGFCAAFSGSYAPFIEKYGEDYARESDGYLDNLISRSGGQLLELF